MTEALSPHSTGKDKPPVKSLVAETYLKRCVLQVYWCHPPEGPKVLDKPQQHRVASSSIKHGKFSSLSTAEHDSWLQQATLIA